MSTWPVAVASSRSLFDSVDQEKEEGKLLEQTVYSKHDLLSKKHSIIDAPASQPTCLENVHYPVFNPQDPRHNTNPDYPMEFFRSESQTSPSDSQQQTPGTPSFSRRSLHKARSGLWALRAGLFNRSSRQGSDILESPAQSKKGHAQRHSHGFSNISSTTQEDHSFGTDLYRNDRAQPRTLDDANVDCIAQASSHPLKNTMSAPQPTTSSCDLVDDLQPALEQTVSAPADPSFVYESYQHSTVTSPLPTEEECTEQHSSIVEDVQKNIADCATPPVTSGDRYTAGPISCSSSDDEDLGGTILLCYSHDGTSEQENQPLKSSLNHEEGTCKKIEALRHLSETRNNPSLEMEQKQVDSKESLELPDYSTPSIAGSETSRRRESTFIRSESSVTQDRLLLGDDSLESQARTSPVSESRKCSADVKIAFPGLYHELLEQWVRETEVSPVIYPGLETESTLKSAHLPSLPSPTSPLHSPDDHPYHPTELPWSLDTHFASGLVDIFNNFQKENTSIPFTSLARPRVVAVHPVRNSITLPFTMDDYTRHTDTQTTRSREGQSDRRSHSFGIHISERNVCICEELGHVEHELTAVLGICLERFYQPTEPTRDPATFIRGSRESVSQFAILLTSRILGSCRLSVRRLGVLHQLHPGQQRCELCKLHLAHLCLICPMVTTRFSH